jgi:uncharacterized protein
VSQRTQDVSGGTFVHSSKERAVLHDVAVPCFCLPLFASDLYTFWSLSMPISTFSGSIAEKLKSYVYVYCDPTDGSVFYVGKGKGNRCFEHLKSDDESEKCLRIKKLRDRKIEPRIDILAFGLTEEEALIVEAAAIDLIGINNLTNRQLGHNSARYGRRSVDDVCAQLGDASVESFEHNMVLIRINKLYDPTFNDLQLYDATRGIWEIAESKRNLVTHACALFQGKIREVYEIASWHPAGSTLYATRDSAELTSSTRFEFVGKLAPHGVAKMYKNRSVPERYLPFGFAGSTRFVGPSFPQPE